MADINNSLGPNGGGVGGGISLIRQEFVFSSSQIFTLSNNYSQVYSVEVQGQGALSTSQYNLIAPNQVEILDTLDSSDYIVVIYSPNTGGVIPYYTQAQVDALIAAAISQPKRILSKSVVNSAIVTGTTVETLLHTFTIPANTVQVGDVIKIKVRVRKTGTAGVVSIRVGGGTLGGALEAFAQSSPTSNLGVELEREFVVKSPTNTEYIQVSQNAYTSQGTSNNYKNTPVDWTIDQTVSIGLNLSNASDSAYISYYELYID